MDWARRPRSRSGCCVTEDGCDRRPTLVEAEGLELAYDTPEGRVAALRGVDLRLRPASEISPPAVPASSPSSVNRPTATPMPFPLCCT